MRVLQTGRMAYKCNTWMCHTIAYVMSEMRFSFTQNRTTITIQKRTSVN